MKTTFHILEMETRSLCQKISGRAGGWSKMCPSKTSIQPSFLVIFIPNWDEKNDNSIHD